jgi:cell division protein FtsI/penicillin-binding protein 2
MAALVDRPPPDFAAVHQKAASTLELTAASYRLGLLQRHGSAAQASFTAQLTLAGLGQWSYDGTLHLARRGSTWLIEWTTTTIHPALSAGSHFARERTWPARAPILGAGGAVLAGPTTVVSIGLEGSRVRDPAVVTAALTKAGAAPAEVQAALVEAAAQPQQFIAVFDLTEDRFAQLDQQLRPVPGIIFQRHAGRATATPDLTVHVVGSFGAITAEELQRLGPPYEVGDQVGQGGIEGAAERQLAGTPSGQVDVVDPAGHIMSTLFTMPGSPGGAVQTTIDLATEKAAERALDGVTQPAAFVAVRVSTGEVLAAVSRPASTPFDRALEGRYPPGSTFKVITTSALLAAGLTVNAPVSCPPTLTIDGRVFHNFEGETQASLTLHRAFAISCNTAFLGLVDRLSPQALITAAEQFGFGSDPQLGLPAFGGRIPVPADQVERAATMIGQARVEASPLQMAAVAAAVASGAYRPPRLVMGAPDDDAAAIPLDPAVVSSLRRLMAEVVSSGTGTPAQPSGSAAVFGKTGTAEFGNATPPTTHAWFIGWRGDVAFAVLVEGGGVGGRVAAPIAARFLRSL